MTRIIAGEKYRDKSGNLYQVLCTALSLESEKNEVVIQQLFGDFLRLCVPQDKFDKVFTNVDVMVTRPPEKEKAISTSERKAIEQITADTDQTDSVEADVSESASSKSDNDGNPAIRDMLIFLDTDDFEEKYKIARKMAELSEIDDTILDNMAASLDLIIDDGSLDDRVDELLRCLGTRKKFETTRLRG